MHVQSYWKENTFLLGKKSNNSFHIHTDLGMIFFQNEGSQKLKEEVREVVEPLSQGYTELSWTQPWGAWPIWPCFKQRVGPEPPEDPRNPHHSLLSSQCLDSEATLAWHRFLSQPFPPQFLQHYTVSQRDRENIFTIRLTVQPIFLFSVSSPFIQSLRKQSSVETNICKNSPFKINLKFSYVPEFPWMTNNR